MPSYRKSAVRSNKVSDPSLGHMVALADIMVATERLRAISRPRSLRYPSRCSIRPDCCIRSPCSGSSLAVTSSSPAHTA